MFDDRVMTGGNVIAIESLGFAPKVTELQLLIAHYAGIRSATGLILARKIVNAVAASLCEASLNCKTTPLRCVPRRPQGGGYSLTGTLTNLLPRRVNRQG